MGKLEAEAYLRQNVPQAYILRPPYLYGPMQNLYREPFVFDCAEQGRRFYLPGAGEMELQFFHVEDLCRFIQILLEAHPEDRIYNVGDAGSVSVAEWVRSCYEAVDAELETVSLYGQDPYRFFCFRPYEYRLDVSRQMALMPETKPLHEGLAESYAWYREHRGDVRTKPYREFLDTIVDNL